MYKTLKKTALLAGIAALLFSLAACSGLKTGLDVVANEAKTSFAALLDAAPSAVSENEQYKGAALTAPDSSIKFIWSRDWSKSPQFDALLEFDAQPFLDAGLDPAKLPGYFIYQNGMLSVGRELGDVRAEDELSAKGAFEEIVNQKRDLIGYHSQMDHYGIDLDNGNMFEWAKDMGANDKDMVFVLNPEPFIEAGVDPNAVEGWVFDKVTVGMGADEKQVDKFLKPFNLK
ncbi:MAG: hypothetical protein LBS36_10220 [Oscillospiraceae bacterium]|jgi:hypothetical protein|nr:hypothetical protein [Oscillospiraceae bacterium]